MKQIKTGTVVSFQGVMGKVLAFYKTDVGYNLNLQCKGYTESFVALTDKEAEQIKLNEPNTPKTEEGNGGGSIL
tara:strand:+ start:140 stop:361 length:222 start_codon:yes stop_codon:yes gene_type:complete